MSFAGNPFVPPDLTKKEMEVLKNKFRLYTEQNPGGLTKLFSQFDQSGSGGLDYEEVRTEAK